MQIPNALLTESVTIHPFTGQSPSGPVYSTSYTAICRYEGKRKVFKDKTSGKELIVEGTLFLLPTAVNLALKRETKIVVDEGTYIVKEIKKQKGFEVSHIEMMVM